MVGAMRGQVNESLGVGGTSKGLLAKPAIALSDRAESEKLAINSPSKLGILEGVFGPFECAKARWGKGFGSLTSKLTRQMSDRPRPTRPEVIARKSTSLRRAPGFRGIAAFAQDPVQKSD